MPKYEVTFPATTFTVEAENLDDAEIEALRQRDMYEEQAGTDAEIREFA